MTDAKPLNPPPPTAAQRRALGILALAALAALVRLALPVGTGLFLGTLIAFTLHRYYRKLVARGWREGTAAVVCAAVSAIVIASTITMLATLFVVRGVELVTSLPRALAHGGSLQRPIAWCATRLSLLHVSPASIATRLQEGAMALGSRAMVVAASLAGAAFEGVLTLLFTTLAIFYVLRTWNVLVTETELLLPFEPRHTHALLDQFRHVGRRVLLGTVLTGLVQGALAAIGYWIAGAPDPAFFGVLTAVASLLPAIGTLLVWIPIGLLRMAQGHLAAGIFELLYGIFIIGILTDYVIRPRLVGNEKGVPAIVTFASLFGGVALFGLVGLVLGPVIATLSVAVLRTYATEVAAMRTRESSGVSTEVGDPPIEPSRP